MQDPEVLVKSEKEAIHSGQFMVSHFEAEAQDDEDELAVPIPDAEDKSVLDVVAPVLYNNVVTIGINNKQQYANQQQLSIETSLAKLFQCMSLAYRQKLTSPKWNRFRGIRLRWKDKIRLNNVIWRCWHMQFILKQDTLICQFASPLDVDTHNKPEAVVLEGKYWKRKLAAVTAEYKKWRMFYRNQMVGGNAKDGIDMLTDMEALTWQNADNMMVDEDYMGLMSDTLFSTITNQPFVFPDSREIAKAGLADFIQPSLGPLQPNLDDYMDTFEPLQELIYSKLPPVPEEQSSDNGYKSVGWGYSDLDILSTSTIQIPSQTVNLDQFSSLNQLLENNKQQQHQLDNRYSNQQQQIMIQNNTSNYPMQNVPYQSVISKSGMDKMPKQQQQQQQISVYKTQPEDVCFQNYQTVEVNKSGTICNVDATLQEEPTYKLLQQTDLVSQNQGYKYPPNVKFTSQNLSNYKVTQIPTSQHQLLVNLQQQSHLPKDPLEMSPPHSREPTTQRRQRSRSNTREPIKRPPLLSAISDPSLVSPSTSALLTQLLTNNSESFLRPQFVPCNAIVDTIQPSSSIGRVKEEASNAVGILSQQKSSSLTALAAAAAAASPISRNSSDTMLLNSMSSSNSPILDQSSTCSRPLESPTSPRDPLGSPGRDPTHRDHRRVGHIHAEQKRRYNIKNGFDMIHSLIPQLNQNPNAKLSKAAMLQKGAEYIRQLRQERNQLKEEMESLKQQIECLNTSISNCQSLLPGTGASVSRRWDNKMQEMFDQYVRTRTLDNWKFWIFSLLFKPLLSSYNNFVSTSSLEDLYRSTLQWIEQHCTLIDLRPVVLNSLRYLCTKTDILAEPERLPDEARQAVLSASGNNK